jgi:hypothetical protein
MSRSELERIEFKPSCTETFDLSCTIQSLSSVQTTQGGGALRVTALGTRGQVRSEPL